MVWRESYGDADIRNAVDGSITGTSLKSNNWKNISNRGIGLEQITEKRKHFDLPLLSRLLDVSVLGNVAGLSEGENRECMLGMAHHVVPPCNRLINISRNSRPSVCVTGAVSACIYNEIVHCDMAVSEATSIKTAPDHHHQIITRYYIHEKTTFNKI